MQEVVVRPPLLCHVLNAAVVAAVTSVVTPVMGPSYKLLLLLKVFALPRGTDIIEHTKTNEEISINQSNQKSIKLSVLLSKLLLSHS